MPRSPMMTDADLSTDLDFDRRYRSVLARDARFDGWFVTAVTSTGIYCRPSCPALTPRRANVRFFPTAAAAQRAGFRACMRCRPDATPGSPEWDVRADVVARAMRLILDGFVDRAGVSGLAAELGYSQRQLHRLLASEVGAGALALARAQRAQTARALIESTELPAAEIAFAAGFDSIRQFNDTVRDVFAMTPTQLRRRRSTTAPNRPPVPAPPHGGFPAVPLRLAFRKPFDSRSLLAFLGARCVPGVETCSDGHYRRSLRLRHGDGLVRLVPGEEAVSATFWLEDLRDLVTAVNRCRRLLDLDADPVAVDEALGSDPLLGGLVRRCPGRRVPGTVDGTELAIRAIIGQQVTVSAARTIAGRLAALTGRPIFGVAPPTTDPPGTSVTHVFPSADDLAALDPAKLPMPSSRGRALVAVASEVAAGRMTIGPGSDPDELAARLTAIRGVGPWTTAYVAMRALGNPDAFMPGDLGVRRAIRKLGQPDGPADVDRIAERWRPWRAYAIAHLWADGGGEDRAA